MNSGNKMNVFGNDVEDVDDVLLRTNLVNIGNAKNKPPNSIKAAGVLPYAKDGSGNTWFLLGRERPNENWGIDSSSWSEFGGSMDKNESCEEGAAREFFEETMGVVFGHKKWMENELKLGRYLLVMDSRTPSGKGYRSFVKQIPFLDFPAKFARYKTISKKQPDLFKSLVPFCFQDDGRLLPSCAEKTSMSWFSVEQLRAAVDKYKKAKSDPNLLNVNLNKHFKSCYDEPENVPHIRRGFAMDLDHLLHTSWGLDNFQNDEKHFSRVYSPDVDLVTTQSGCLKPIIKTPRFTNWSQDQNHFQRHEERSQTTQSENTHRTLKSGPLKKLGRPPIVTVNTEGYSFKKKRKRKNKNTKHALNAGPEKITKVTVTLSNKHASKKKSEWTVVSSKKSTQKHRRNAAVRSERYKPNPPSF
jgi:hypothetical protein